MELNVIETNQFFSAEKGVNQIELSHKIGTQLGRKSQIWGSSLWNLPTMLKYGSTPPPPWGCNYPCVLFMLQLLIPHCDITIYIYVTMNYATSHGSNVMVVVDKQSIPSLTRLLKRLRHGWNLRSRSQCYFICVFVCQIQPFLVIDFRIVICLVWWEWHNVGTCDCSRWAWFVLSTWVMRRVPGSLTSSVSLSELIREHPTAYRWVIRTTQGTPYCSQVSHQNHTGNTLLSTGESEPHREHPTAHRWVRITQGTPNAHRWVIRTTQGTPTAYRWVIRTTQWTPYCSQVSQNHTGNTYWSQVSHQNKHKEHLLPTGESSEPHRELPTAYRWVIRTTQGTPYCSQVSHQNAHREHATANRWVIRTTQGTCYCQQVSYKTAHIFFRKKPEKNHNILFSKMCLNQNLILYIMSAQWSGGNGGGSLTLF